MGKPACELFRQRYSSLTERARLTSNSGAAPLSGIRGRIENGVKLLVIAKSLEGLERPEALEIALRQGTSTGTQAARIVAAAFLSQNGWAARPDPSTHRRASGG